jgi:UDP-glucuronate 4-epimerase
VAKTILVTGAAGFIGSHAVERLVRRGDRVIGLDNLNDYYDPARKEANLREVRDQALAKQWPGTFEFLKGDIRDRQLVADLFSDHHIDAIVHLAAMAGVRVSIDDPGLYYDVNVMGTLALLADWCQEPRKVANLHFCFDFFSLRKYPNGALRT